MRCFIGGATILPLSSKVGYCLLLAQALALACPVRGAAGIAKEAGLTGTDGLGQALEGCSIGPHASWPHCSRSWTAAVSTDVGLPAATLATRSSLASSVSASVSRMEAIAIGGVAAAAAVGNAVAPEDAATTSSAAAVTVAAAARAVAGSASTGGGRRLLATAPPSSISNGSASATFPATTFASWCTADSTCSQAGTLTLTLPYYTDASPFTSVTLNWPDVFSGTGVSALQLVSGVLELQLVSSSGYTAKQDQIICDNVTNCTAQLSIPYNASAVDLTQSFVCLRLEPSVTGSSYQAYGYPPGSNGTSLATSVDGGSMQCNTNRFGKHIIMQYKQAALVPPSPPPQPPSSSPPPPLNTVGATYTSDVRLQMKLPVSLGFDTLKSNSTLLSDLTSSLESSLAASLTAAGPSLLLPSTSNIASAISKISRATNKSASAVVVNFQLLVPAGATQGQVTALMNLLMYNTTGVFNGSPYTSYFSASAEVSYILSSSSSSGVSTRAVIAIALCSMVATLLVMGIGYGLYNWRAYVAILPKKPVGPWDESGVTVAPRKSGRRRKAVQAKQDAAAAEADSGLQSPLPPSQLGASAVEARIQQAEFPWEVAMAGGGGGGGGGGGSVGGGRSSWIMKSQAELNSPTAAATAARANAGQLAWS